MPRNSAGTASRVAATSANHDAQNVAQPFALLVKETPLLDDRMYLLDSRAHAKRPKRWDTVGSKIDVCPNQGPMFAASHQLWNEALTV